MNAQNIYDMCTENERLKQLIDKYAKELKQALKDKEAWKQLAHKEELENQIFKKAFSILNEELNAEFCDNVDYAKEFIERAKGINNDK